MINKTVIVGLIVLLVNSACTVVEAKEINYLKGRYAFDWKKDPLPSNCIKIGERLLSLFESEPYSCDPHERNNSTSGEYFVTCTRKDQKVEYMIFKTAKSCEAERRDQAVNE
jgi:hypothetical protein